MTLWAKVRVTGHRDGCPSGTPRQYVWQLDGQLKTGTLAAYGASFEIEYTVLPRTGLGSELRTWDATYSVTVEHLAEPDEEGSWPVRLTAGNESVDVTAFAVPVWT